MYSVYYLNSTTVPHTHLTEYSDGIVPTSRGNETWTGPADVVDVSAVVAEWLNLSYLSHSKYKLDYRNYESSSVVVY